MGNCEYVCNFYGVPACIGRRVIAYGKPGVIAEDRGNYIGIQLDCDKPGMVNNYHPVDGIEYLNVFGKVRRGTRSQERYREFLHSEYPDSFADFIGVDTRCTWSGGGYQYVNDYRGLRGPVCRLKKDAKTGYKAILTARKSLERELRLAA